MPSSKDTVNTGSVLGQNMTPPEVLDAAREVMGEITHDPCSDEVANQFVKAKTYFSFVEDGYSWLMKLQDGCSWLMKSRASVTVNAFMNPPGQSYTGGTRDEREELQGLTLISQTAKKLAEQSGITDSERAERRRLLKEAEDNLKAFLKAHPEVKSVTAADWFRALYLAWKYDYIQKAIWLQYRLGSAGSQGNKESIDDSILKQSIVCITAAGAPSPAINGSGRFSFLTMQDDGTLAPQPSNTQASMIGYLPDKANRQYDEARFERVFKQFGVIKR